MIETQFILLPEPDKVVLFFYPDRREVKEMIESSRTQANSRFYG